MRIAIHQPNYLPWLGFWQKVAQADVLIMLDTVEYTKGGYINRTQVQGPHGPAWLTVPVQAHLHTPITEIWEADANWPLAHLHKLQLWYRDAPYASRLPLIASWLSSVPRANLATINEGLIRSVAAYLGLTTKILCASELGVTNTDRTGRLVALCQAVSATPGIYLSGRGGLAYHDTDQFTRAGWEVTPVVSLPPSPYSVLHGLLTTEHIAFLPEI